MLYLDSNATTKPLPAVVDAVRECMESAWANPSSVHRLGVDARHRIELARSAIAQLVGCQEREIVFASGGTEAVNLAIFGTLESWREREASSRAPLLVTSRLEHSAVRESADAWERRGGETLWIEHDPRGLVDLEWLASTLAAHAGRPTLVSLMWANNETGVIQPIEKVGTLCRTHGARFHTDATQWVGKMPTDVSALQVDLLSFAAHKFHGPKGVGALYLRRGVRVERQAIGGPQERDRRGGTENVAGIVGMGVAAAEASRWLLTGERERLRAERDRFEQTLIERCPGAVVNGRDAPRLWNTSNVAFPRLEAEAILLLLSERGICASAGAACSSGSLDPSPVLLAMGIAPELAHGSVRFSLSRFTTSEEVSEAIAEIPRAIEKLSLAMR